MVNNLGVIFMNHLSGVIHRVGYPTPLPRYVNGLIEASHCTPAHTRTLRLQWCDGNQTLKPGECDDSTDFTMKLADRC